MILLLFLILLLPLLVVAGAAVTFVVFCLWLLALIRAVFRESFVRRAGEE